MNGCQEWNYINIWLNAIYARIYVYFVKFIAIGLAFRVDFILVLSSEMFSFQKYRITVGFRERNVPYDKE